MKQVTEE